MDQQKREDTQDIRVQLVIDLDGSYPLLCSLYKDQLYAYVMHQTLNEEDTRDILQEVFERTYRALKEYPPERVLSLQMRPWLYAIAKHTCLNALRKRRTASSVSLDTAEDSMHLDIPGPESETPEAMAATHELRHELLALIARLPPRYHEAVFWYFFQHLSYYEIAEKQGKTVGAVRTEVSRGLAQLRHMLPQRGEQDNGSLPSADTM